MSTNKELGDAASELKRQVDAIFEENPGDRGLLGGVRRDTGYNGEPMPYLTSWIVLNEGDPEEVRGMRIERQIRDNRRNFPLLFDEYHFTTHGLFPGEENPEEITDRLNNVSTDYVLSFDVRDGAYNKGRVYMGGYPKDFNDAFWRNRYESARRRELVTFAEVTYLSERISASKPARW